MSKKDNKGLSLAPLIQEAERTLRAAVKHFGLKTAADSIVVTIQTQGRGSALGWFWAERWVDGQKQPVNEINMSAETLATCDVGELLIHELAHAENNTLGIEDCSGQVHNKRFKTMAERLGLQCAEKRDKKYGWGFTKLGPEAAKFLEKIKFDKSLFSTRRVQPTPKGSGPGSRLLKVCCTDCDYTVRVTQKWIDVGLPTCCCGEKMEVA